MNPIAGQFTSIEQVNDQYLNRQNVKQSPKASDISFEDILRKQQNKAELQKDSGVRFSKHATQRLETRNIQLSSEQSARLEDGVMKAQEKGIKEVVFDRGGYIYAGKVAALADAAREAGLEF